MDGSSTPSNPAAAPTPHACATCFQVFPEHMMKLVGARWHCMPCNVNNEEQEAERKSGPRYGIGLGLGFREIPMWVRVALGLLAAVVWSVPRFIHTFGKSSAFYATVEPAEPWAGKPKTEWPSLTLVNEVELQGVPKSTGGNGFLIAKPDGKILGVTPTMRTALGNKEDEPSLTNAELNRRFVSWRMFPFNTPGRAINLSGFYGVPTEHSGGEIWVLQAATADKNSLPVTPLKVRRTALVRGIRLFVVARPFDDASGKQQVYPCTVQDVAIAGEVADLVYDNAVVSRGFAGAPVVDVQGHLAAVVSGPGEEPRKDGAVTWLQAVGVTGLQRLTK